jgi:hypothetical protein
MMGSGESKEKFSVRRYRESDEKSIRELRGISLSSERDRAWWKWQYIDNPSGPAIVWLAEVNKQLAGHYAILPLSMIIGNKPDTGALSVDTMTRPDYQRQGIFVTLANKTYDDALNKKISIVCGTPNDQSYPGFAGSLQWFEICNVPMLVKVIDWGATLKKRFNIPVLTGKLLGNVFEKAFSINSRSKDMSITIEQIENFDKSFDEFWLKASEIHKIMIVKNTNYLNWRYIKKPNHGYAIFAAKRQNATAGYIVLNVIRNNPVTGNVIDLLTLPNDNIAAEELIKRAVKYFKQQQAITVSCAMMQNASYYKVLRESGFLRRKSWIRLCARILNPSLSKEYVSNPDNWYWTRGDDGTI